MLSSLKRFNNSQQLAIVGLILYFSKNHLLTKKDYQMPLTQIIRNQLTENYTNCIAR